MMRKIVYSLLLMSVLFAFCGVSCAKEWQQGGTLHNATIAEWKRSSHENKLATCADWLSALYLRGNLDVDIDEFDDLKKYAEALVGYVDKTSAKTSSLNGEKANAIALVGMMMAGWIKDANTSLSDTKPSTPASSYNRAAVADEKLKSNGFLTEEEVDEVWESETTLNLGEQLSSKQKKAIIAEYKKAKRESEQSSRKFGSGIEDELEREFYQDGVCKNKILKATRAIAEKYGIKAGDVVALAEAED